MTLNLFHFWCYVFQGICLRHSNYWGHSLIGCSARRLYIQWLVFCFNNLIWHQWRGLNNVQWLKLMSHLAALRQHGVVKFPRAPFFLNMAMSRLSYGVSTAISRRPWRFYGVLVGDSSLACALTVLSWCFHCVHRVVTARALRSHCADGVLFAFGGSWNK